MVSKWCEMDFATTHSITPKATSEALHVSNPQIGNSFSTGNQIDVENHTFQREPTGHHVVSVQYA